jgi:predicted RNA binding protein YcfA (HicA-like mRNA interferase family)
MPPFGPTKRRDLIRTLKALGFDGPYSGGNHQYMVRDQTRLRIPNPHQGDTGRGLLSRILRQAGVSREVWENL